jgi:alanyl-tRNA synthetase
LTKLMAEERGMCVDEAGYAAAQSAAKERSRSGKGGEGVVDPKSAVVLDVHLTAELDGLKVVKTDDAPKYTSAVLEGCHVTALVQDGRLVQSVGESDALVGIILDRTNFYAEEGGQQADIGSLQAVSAAELSTIAEFEVLSVQVYSGWVLHIGRVKFGAFAVGQAGIQVAFDEMNRRSLRQNHSATHLLNFALRSVVTSVDEQIDQKGSLVAADRFRFDFNLTGALTDAQVAAIEAKVRECVAADLPVATAVLPLAKAREINGLRAVFGETYPDPVRVVVMGVQDVNEVLADASSPRWAAMSVELCGGTHVSKTSQIGAFVVLSESNISKGIRRMVAVTGEAAERAQEAAASLESHVGYTEIGLKEAEAAAKTGATAGTEAALTVCDSSIKSLGKEVDEAVIPAVIKSSLRERVASMRKSVGDALKALRAVLSTRVVDQVISSLASVQLSESRVVVMRVEGADARGALLPALQKMAKSGAGVDAVAVVLYAVDEVAKRVFYHAAVLKTGEADASVLLQKFGEKLEGAKCGGSASLAQGSALIPSEGRDWESELKF